MSPQKGALRKIKSSQEPFIILRCWSENLTAFLAIFCTGTRSKGEPRERQQAREIVSWVKRKLKHRGQEGYSVFCQLSVWKKRPREIWGAAGRGRKGTGPWTWDDDGRKELREGCSPAGLAELQTKTMIPEEERINLSWRDKVVVHYLPHTLQHICVIPLSGDIKTWAISRLPFNHG